MRPFFALAIAMAILALYLRNRFGLFGAIVNRLREVFWGVERDDLEMILFTLHPFLGLLC